MEVLNIFANLRVNITAEGKRDLGAVVGIVTNMGKI